MSTRFVPLEDVLFIHEMIIELTGGKGGVRDFTLFHSAVMRPVASFGGEDLYKSVFDKEAALIHSLLLNHPFNDGNRSPRPKGRGSLIFAQNSLHLRHLCRSFFAQNKNPPYVAFETR